MEKSVRPAPSPPSPQGGSVHFGLLAQFIPHTGLPSGLTRGPLSTCKKPGFRGSQAGPRVEPEGSTALVWAITIEPEASKVNTPPQGGGEHDSGHCAV